MNFEVNLNINKYILKISIIIKKIILKKFQFF